MERNNNRFDFKYYKGNTSELIEYGEINGNFIFALKLSENFRRKARFVDDGHFVETPASTTYSTVVLRESVRILLLADTLSGLKKWVKMRRVPYYQMTILKRIGLGLALNFELNKGNDLLL